jgi:hypothetical protein
MNVVCSINIDLLTSQYWFPLRLLSSKISYKLVKILEQPQQRNYNTRFALLTVEQTSRAQFMRHTFIFSIVAHVIHARPYASSYHIIPVRYGLFAAYNVRVRWPKGYF